MTSNPPVATHDATSDVIAVKTDSPRPECTYTGVELMELKTINQSLQSNTYMT